MLRALTEAHGHAITLAAGRRILPEPAFERVVAGLERDGLLHRSGGKLRLGGRPEPAATIGP